MVTGASVDIEWHTTRNGVYQVPPFPPQVFLNRISRFNSNMLELFNVKQLDDDFGYVCNVSIDNMVVVSRIAYLTVNSKPLLCVVYMCYKTWRY